MDKRDIRRSVRSRIALLSEQQKTEASQQIFAKIATLPAFENAKVVALFASLHDEPQTEQFIAEWHGRKRIVLPRCEGEVMNFYDYSPDVMESGSFGINEPQGVEPCRPSEIDFMVIPGVAFTPDGRRLGRGKGFYDRYLSQEEFAAITVGICFREQVVDDIPSESHDKVVESVIAY